MFVHQFGTAMTAGVIRIIWVTWVIHALALRRRMVLWSEHMGASVLHGGCCALKRGRGKTSLHTVYCFLHGGAL